MIPPILLSYRSEPRAVITFDREAPAAFPCRLLAAVRSDGVGEAHELFDAQRLCPARGIDAHALQQALAAQ